MTYIINALRRPEINSHLIISLRSKNLLSYIVFSMFADFVTVDAIARNRENFLSTLSVIAVKEKMRRFTQYSRLNILSTVLFNMDRRAVLVSRSSIGRLLIRTKRNVRFPTYIGDGARIPLLFSSYCKRDKMTCFCSRSSLRMSDESEISLP